MNKIQLYITGGTLDKRYNELNGELHFEQSQIETMLHQARCTLTIEHEVLMLKDSLDMSDEDRQQIVTCCANSHSDYIVLTHGTDTMVDTAKALAGEIKDKTVVLVGAMVPYSFGRSSDALFNLGSALTAVQLLPANIYITMNGRIFTWDKVKKNRALGQFQ